MAALAKELFDEIAQLVDDSTDLKALSLASRAFVWSCQRQLFRTWLLYDRDRELPSLRKFTRKGPLVLLTFKKARKLRAKHPHLLAHARDLTVDLREDAPLGWLEEILLPQTPPLTRLAIRNQFAFREVNMRSLALTTSPLAHVFFLPTLCSFHLQDFEGVPQNFVPFALSRFDEVKFIDIGIEKEAYSPPLPLGPTKTKTFAFISSSDVLHDPKHFLTILDIDLHKHLRGIQTLSITLGLQKPNRRSLLEEGDWVETLERLEIGFMDYLQPFPQRSFTALRSLTLDFPILIKALSTGGDASLTSPGLTSDSNFENLIKTLPTTAPGLESLTLGIDVTFAFNGPESWPPLDAEIVPFATFTTMQQLPKLKKLHFDVSPSQHAEGFEDYVGRLFPGPREARILSFSTSD
ncbi:hypothetical protein R3P38DRAFT_3367607 [Favolaschia claudopus]|uniref:F-box domain-containing protein n=1 Tax=Favolaschia claudopus TaxID=2862362 RepID=A0AAW0A826_9AGAR